MDTLIRNIKTHWSQEIRIISKIVISKLLKRDEKIIELISKEDKEVIDKLEFGEGLVTNYTVSVTGDMDSDGKVSASDARLVLRAAARIENPEGAFFTAADVNLDGKITAADARKTLLVAANMTYFEETYEY